MFVIHSSVNGHGGGGQFHVWILWTVLQWIRERRYPLVISMGIHMPSHGIDGSYSGFVFHFLKNLHFAFRNSCASVHDSWQRSRGFVDVCWSGGCSQLSDRKAAQWWDAADEWRSDVCTNLQEWVGDKSVLPAWELESTQGNPQAGEVWSGQR